MSQINTFGVKIEADVSDATKFSKATDNMGDSAEKNAKRIASAHGSLAGGISKLSAEAATGASKFQLHTQALAQNANAALSMARALGPISEAGIRAAEGIERFAARSEIFTERSSKFREAQASLTQAFSAGAIAAPTLAAAQERLALTTTEAATAAEATRAAVTKAATAEREAADVAGALAQQKRVVKDAEIALNAARNSSIPTNQILSQSGIATALQAEAKATAALEAEVAGLTLLEGENVAVSNARKVAQEALAATAKQEAAANRDLAASQELVNGASAGVGNSMLALVGTVALVVAGLVALVAAYEAVKHAIEFTTEAIKEAGAEQSLSINLREMIGNADVAKEKFEELHAFWEQSGIFSQKDIVDAASYMTLIGTGTDNLIDRVKDLSQFAAASGESVRALAGDYQKVREAIIRGTDIPLRGGGSAGLLAFMKALEDETGKTEDEIQRLFKTHAIGIDLVNKALHDAATGEGRFADAILLRQNSWEGSLARLKTAWESLKESFGEPLLDVITPLITSIGSKIGELRPQFAEAGKWMAETVTEWVDAIKAGQFQETFEAKWKSGLDAVTGYLHEHMAQWLTDINSWILHLPVFVFKANLEWVGGSLNSAVTSLMTTGAKGSASTGLPNGLLIDPLDPSNPLNSSPGESGISPAINLNRDSDRAAQARDSATKFLGDISRGGSDKESDFDKQKTDLKEINDLWEQMALIEAQQGSQTEKNARINDAFAKTVKQLYDPTQVLNQVGALTQEGVVNAKLLLQEEARIRAQQQLNAAIKANTATVGQSFVSGINEATRAWGNLDEQVQQAGKDITNSLSNDLSSTLADISDGTIKTAEDFKTAAASIIKDIERIIIKLLVELAIQKLLGGISGGSTVSAAQLGIGTVAHAGAIVGAGSNIIRSVDLSVFDNAPRYHGGGILPGERPIIAEDGEGIFTQEQMANLAPVSRINNSNNQTTITVHINNNGDKGTSSRVTGTADEKDAREFVRKVETIASATFNKQRRFGGTGYTPRNP